MEFVTKHCYPNKKIQKQKLMHLSHLDNDLFLHLQCELAVLTTLLARTLCPCL